MATPSQTAAEIDEFLTTIVGAWIDTDNFAGYQCKDLPDYYGMVLFGTPLFGSLGPGNAETVLVNANPAYWKVILNDPRNREQLPIRGDVIVWDGVRENPHGHTALVLSADPDGVDVVEQDGGLQGPVTRNRWGWDIPSTGPVLGWLRPRPEKVLYTKADIRGFGPQPPKEKPVSYKYETQWSTPPWAFTRGRPGVGKPTNIVIHHYGPDEATYESSINHLIRPGATTSAHYVVDTDRVACIVSPEDTAWHAGDWDTNLRSIGIENHPIWTQARENTLIQLCADLEEEYGSLTYTIHKNHHPTACPGRWEKRIPAIIAGVNNELARRRNPNKNKPVTPSVSGYVHKPGVKAYHTVVKGDTLTEIARYYNSKVPLIVQWNKLPDANTINVGQKLRVR